MSNINPGGLQELFMRMMSGASPAGPSTTNANRGPFGAFDPAFLAAMLGDSGDDTDSMHEDNSRNDLGEVSGCLSMPYNARTREVRIATDTIDGKACKVFVILDPGARGCLVELLDNVHVVCKVNNKEIGHALARFVRKEKHRQTWWDTTKPAKLHLQYLQQNVFDRYGRVLEEHTTHPHLKGTGVWGPELDRGDILFWDHFDTSKYWRSKGLNTLLLKHVRQAMYSTNSPQAGNNAAKKAIGDSKPLLPRNPTFEFCLPKHGFIMPDLMGKTAGQAEKYKKNSKMLEIQWFRSLGFRRIGLSEYFGYVNDPSHPSRTLPSHQDKDIPEIPARKIESDAEESLRIAALRRDNPLIYATIYMCDDDCVKVFKTKYANLESPAWKQSDELKDNVLHRAALGHMSRSVKYIMDRVDPKLKLSTQLNCSNFTPLEIFQDRIDDRQRNGWETDCYTQLIHDQFKGYSTTDTQILAALNGVHPTTPAQLAKFKYGCKCGSCIGGILSPHLYVIITSHAEALSATLLIDIKDGVAWTKKHASLLKNVSRSLLNKMPTDEMFRHGFVGIVSAIYACLEKKQLPKRTAVTQVIKSSQDQNSKKFVGQGGKVEDGLRVVFEQARSGCMWAGDGSGLALYSDKLDALKRCRNDGEYACAALACGIEDL